MTVKIDDAKLARATPAPPAAGLFGGRRSEACRVGDEVDDLDQLAREHEPEFARHFVDGTATRRKGDKPE